MTPYYQAPDGALYLGDVVDVLRELEGESVQCCVTSPPYWSLRDYKMPGQIGLEPTIEEYVGKMVEVFREVWRVLRNDGTLWLNIGDSYMSSPSNQNGTGLTTLEGGTGKIRAGNEAIGRQKRIPSGGLKPKDLCGIPWRVALALQADGWYLRAEITWCKAAPMPESVTDRPTSATEKIFLLTKSARYFYDAEAVRVPATYGNHPRTIFDNGPQEVPPGTGPHNGLRHAPGPEAGRNLWNYWVLGPEPFKEAHFATFVTEIPRRAILAGTSERGCCRECGQPWRREINKEFIPQLDVSRERGVKGAAGQKPMDRSSGWEGVPRGSSRIETTGWLPSCAHELPPVPCVILDPFVGSGTSCAVARQLGRRWIGIDLSPAYLRLARRRIEAGSLPFESVGARTL